LSPKDNDPIGIKLHCSEELGQALSPSSDQGFSLTFFWIYKFVNAGGGGGGGGL